MNTCNLCKQSSPESPNAVIEIVNPSKPILFHKVVFPASLGDDTTNPPDTLNYKNVLLQYEANNHVYLYSSDGAATMLPTGATDLTPIKEELAQHGIDIDNLQTGLTTETTNREQADTDLQNSIDILIDDLESEAHARIQKDTALDIRITNNETNITNLQTDLQDITTELQGDIASEALAREEADSTLQTNIDAINSNLNQEVEQSTDFTTDTSTVTVNHTKVNLSNNTTSQTTDPLPIASETQAGVMNTATYTAVQNNSEDIDTILNGAVALEGLSATATQEDLTNAWKEATGKANIVNRASIYDIDNDKVWYYYSNIDEWKPLTASTEGEVNISVFTNDTAGIIKGSENEGQVFAEADGTGSVVGWDGLQHDVENILELLETNPIPKLYSTYSTNKDGANTALFINSRLNGDPLALGFGASFTRIGTSAYTHYAIALGEKATAATGPSDPNAIAIGHNANAGLNSMAFGYASEALPAGSIAIGNNTKAQRAAEVSFGSSTTTRFLANVTAGELDTDAVNLKQMQDYVAEHAGGGDNFNPLEYYPVIMGDYASSTNANEHCVNIGTDNAVTTDLIDFGLANPLYKVAIGNNNTTYGPALALGSTNICYGVSDSELPGLSDYMINFGYNNRVGAHGIAIGSNINQGKTGSDLSSSGITIGNNITGWGSNSVAIGHNTKVGQFAGSTAVGDNATATGSMSMALGSYATASNSNSIALGGATTTRSYELNIGTGMAAIMGGCRYIGKVAAGTNDDDAVNLKQLNTVKDRSITYLYTGPSGSANNINLDRQVQPGMEEVTVIASYNASDGRSLKVSTRGECGQLALFTLSLLVPPSTAGTGNLTFLQDTWQMNATGTEYDLVSSTTTTIGSSRTTTYNTTSNFSIEFIDGHWRS